MGNLWWNIFKAQRDRILKKKASIFSDEGGSVASTAILNSWSPTIANGYSGLVYGARPGEDVAGGYGGYDPAALQSVQLGSMANNLGKIHGVLAGTPTKKEIDAINKNPGLSMAPGVGASRSLRKQLYYSKDTPRGRQNILGEQIGGGIADFLTVGAGGLVGALAAPAFAGKGFVPNDTVGARITGGLVGVAAGAGVAGIAHLAAMIAAAAIKRRSKEAQNEHDQHIQMSNWLLPGAAKYNHYKRIGAIQGIEEAEKDRKEKRNAKKNKA